MIRTLCLVTPLIFSCVGCSSSTQRPSPSKDAAAIEQMEIDHVVYFVMDLQRAKRFYAETLGFALMDEYPGFARVRVGSKWIGLKTTEQNGEDVGRGPMVYLRVNDVQGLVDRLLLKGAAPLTVVREVPTGLITTILDSEGNAIGLYQEKP